MTKKLFLVAVCICALTGTATAVPFTHTVDFSGSGTAGLGGPSATYLIVTDAAPFTYSHSLAGIPAGSTLVNASLSITHAFNLNTIGEIWVVFENSLSLSIGQLSASQISFPDGGGTAWWQTDTFALTPAVLTQIQSTIPWSLQVRLNETTSGTDMIWLDKSVLGGNYNVPEPASLSLLGLGLLGLLKIRKMLG